MSISRIYTTEQQSVSTAQQTNAAKTEYKNSVMTDVINNTSVEENTSKVSQSQSRLVELAKKYNLDIEKVFKSKIEELSDEACERLSRAIEAAVKDLTNKKNGSIDIDKIGELAQKYNIGLLTGWSIDGFRNAQNGKQESLQERLKRAVSADSVEEALDKYYNEYFEKNLEKKLANISDPKEREKIIKQEQLRQLQDFGRLLANTPEKDRAIFIQAAKSLYANNRLPGLSAAFETLNAEQKTKEANKISAEWIAELGVKKDQFGNVSDKEELQGISRLVNRYKDTEHSKEFWNETFKTINEFEEAYDSLKAKEAEGKLTEEEKKLLHKYEIYKHIISGGTVGTVENKIIAPEDKTAILKDINNNTSKISEDFYNETLNEIVEFVENNENSLSIPREEFDKILTEATDNKYTEALTTYRTNIETKETNTTTPDLGFTTKPEPANYNKQEELLKNILYSSSDEEDTKFTVEKNIASEAQKNISTSEMHTLKNNAYRSASNITSYLKESGESKFKFATEVFKNFNDMGSTTQDWAINYFVNASSTVKNLFLNKITNSISGMVAAAKEVDISKFNLIGVSTTTQKQIDKIQQEKTGNLC